MILRDWKEVYVDRMGLIVALSGEDRFQKLTELKRDMVKLPQALQMELMECLRQRFTPSNSDCGCQSATKSVRLVCWI